MNKIARPGVLFNFTIGRFLILIVYALDKHALGLFLPSTGAALAISSHLNAIVLWSYLFFGASMVCSEW